MSLISRLKAVVAGDDYLDDDFDELDYESENDFNSINDQRVNHRNSSSFSGSIIVKFKIIVFLSLKA